MPDLAELRRLVEGHFRVYDAREQATRGQVTARFFYLMVPPGEFDARYARLRAELDRSYPDLLTFVRREGGEDILFVADRPPAPARRLPLHLGLFLATVATTVLAGAWTWQGYAHPSRAADWGAILDPDNLLRGAVTFAFPLMAILGIHEMAHFVAARRHGLRPTLPYFIPAPPILLFGGFGTFGAYISMRDPLPDRKALFDVGVSGPIAGFLVALPVLLLGAFLTQAGAVAVPDIGRPHVGADVPFALEAAVPGHVVLRLDQPAPGPFSFNVTAPTDVQDWRYAATATVHFVNGTTRTDSQPAQALGPGATDRRTLAIPEGATSAELALTWNDGLVRFGNPLLVVMLAPLFEHNDDYLTHPLFLAGWVGLLIAGINLLPIGQLDGGHISRALFGERSLWVARGTFAALLLLVVTGIFEGWLWIALFVLAVGLRHPPPLNDRTRLGRGRLAVGVAVAVILALTFIPVPIQV